MRHMSAHDPDSSAAEKALALKIGRQKKVSCFLISTQHQRRECLGHLSSISKTS